LIQKRNELAKSQEKYLVGAISALDGEGQMSVFDDPKLWLEFSANPPAHRDAITKFEAEKSISLPKEYVDFLLRMNGGYGFVGEAYFTFWRIEELIEDNKGYGITENAPGLLAFGSNGGGEAYAFDMRFCVNDVICIPFMTLDWEDAIRIAPTFDKFVEKVSASGSPFDSEAE
jgi:hypothetical protein